MLKILALTANSSHIPRVQKLGSGKQLWVFYILGQAKIQLRPKVRPGFFWLGLAWLLASSWSWHITNYVCMALLKCKRWQHNAVLYSDQPLLTAFLDLDTSIIKNRRLRLAQVFFLKVDSEHFKLPGNTSEPKKLDFLVKLLKHCRKENGLWGVNHRLMMSSAQSIYFNPPWQLGVMRVRD